MGDIINLPTPVEVLLAIQARLGNLQTMASQNQFLETVISQVNTNAIDKEPMKEAIKVLRNRIGNVVRNNKVFRLIPRRHGPAMYEAIGLPAAFLRPATEILNKDFVTDNKLDIVKDQKKTGSAPDCRDQSSGNEVIQNKIQNIAVPGATALPSSIRSRSGRGSKDSVPAVPEKGDGLRGSAPAARGNASIPLADKPEVQPMRKWMSPSEIVLAGDRNWVQKHAESMRSAIETAARACCQQEDIAIDANAHCLYSPTTDLELLYAMLSRGSDWRKWMDDLKSEGPSSKLRQETTLAGLLGAGIFVAVFNKDLLWDLKKSVPGRLGKDMVYLHQAMEASGQEWKTIERYMSGMQLRDPDFLNGEMAQHIATLALALRDTIQPHVQKATKNESSVNQIRYKPLCEYLKKAIREAIAIKQILSTSQLGPFEYVWPVNHRAIDVDDDDAVFHLPGEMHVLHTLVPRVKSIREPDNPVFFARAVVIPYTPRPKRETQTPGAETSEMTAEVTDANDGSETLETQRPQITLDEADAVPKVDALGPEITLNEPDELPGVSTLAPQITVDEADESPDMNTLGPKITVDEADELPDTNILDSQITVDDEDELPNVNTPADAALAPNIDTPGNVDPEVDTPGDTDRLTNADILFNGRPAPDASAESQTPKRERSRSASDADASYEDEWEDQYDTDSQDKPSPKRAKHGKRRYSQ